MVEVSSAIEELSSKFDVLPETLANNEHFVSFVLQASLVAVKNHQQEKLRALRCALVSAGSAELNSDDLAFQYLRYIDELSVTHLRILHCLVRFGDEFSGLSQIESMLILLEEKLGASLDRAAFRGFLNDLEQRFLILAVDVDELPEFASSQSFRVLESSQKKGLMITSLGAGMIGFINEHET